jgi:predicted ArsR family transcriptional regulator
MKSTRHRLLDYLGLKQIATSTELSRLLQVTSADVRHHLNLLHKEGLIEIIGEKQPQGPGRPAKLYSLSQKQKQANLVLLIEALLQVITSEYSPGDRSIKMQQVAVYISGSTNPNGNLSQRLFHAINRLNELNYQARWEAHQQTPRIILGNCPYAAIVYNHPEICQIDKYLLESMLNLPVEQESKLIRDDREFTYCIFYIADITEGMIPLK